MSVLTLLLWLLLLLALFTVLTCIMCAGLWRFMLRGVGVSTPFYLGFGSDEWRLLAIAGVKFLVLLAWALIAAAAIGAIELITKWLSGGFSPLIFVLLLLLAVLALAWLGTRFSLAGPATVKAQKIDLAASWYASAHNVTALQRVAGWLAMPAIVLFLLLLVVLLLVFVQWLSRSGVQASDLAAICVVLLAKLRYLLPLLLLVLYLAVLFVAALFIAARALEYQEATSSGPVI